ncbi:pentapeptide repeat-containing protein [Nostoc sp. FACHB-190]|uniref:nSTAND1 domain-containing NTPase n=1 Tax=Nostoc sp. FACHB-190 TaxID=2692838 RepID=UPI00168647FE|nr:pentapeptide repeat-containing protein [Nostoc sp. FACHB-190]MBD2303251.1 pentapeptide repeat-containing protein [Nostoc sp. FACHB-190]
MSRDALVVGINTYSYERLSNLTAPAIDAEAVAKLLEGYGEFNVKRLPAVKDKQNNTIRVGQKAQVTLTQLEDAIVQLFKPERRNIPDTALLYFSGHGLRKNQGIQEGFLATSDTNPDVSNWGLRLKWLRELLQESEVRQQIIWLDCCYSGELLNFAEADSGDRGKGRDRCFIAASREFEPAFVGIGTNHSVFTTALLQALEPRENQQRVTNYTIVDAISQNIAKFPQRPIFANSGGIIHLTRTQEVIPEVWEVPENAVTSQVCPYRGLRYFDCKQEDAQYFYGRQALTDQLLEKVRVGNFLAVLGASGSGKSSVVRAGLLYQLQQGKRLSGSETWKIRIFRPGDHPLQSLAQVFLDESLSDIQRASQLKEVEDLIGEGDFSRLITVARTPRVVLLIDQFEEVFALCTDRKERQQFFDCLLAGLQRCGDKLFLVLTMRADFFGKCAEYGELTQQIQENLVTVTRMTEEELRHAITEPPKQVDLQVEPELVNQMIVDVEGSPGSLPLLQYTLTELWQQRSEEKLTISAYTRLGGVKGTLQKRATEIYENLLPDEQLAAKRIFLELTQLGEGTEDTRRRVLLGDLVTSQQSNNVERKTFMKRSRSVPEGNNFASIEIEKVIQKLADAKLIVTSTLIEKGSKSGKVAVVDVSHEALIRHWSLLGKWLDENRDKLRQKRKIEAAAQEWRDKGKAKDYLLQRKPLQDAKAFQKQQAVNLALSSLVEEFISKSLKHEQNNRIKFIGFNLIAPLCLVVFLGFFITREIKIRQHWSIIDAADGKANSSARNLALEELVKLGVNLKRINLKGVNLSFTDFSNANLSNANLSGVDLRRADLKGADLWRADLTGSNLSDANLSGVDLRFTNLSNANLSNANLSNARGFYSTNLSNAHLRGANLSNAKFNGANLSFADLSSAYLSSADLSNADLRRANLSNTSLRGANLRNAKFNGTNLSFADLSFADLSNFTDIRGVNLSNVNLSRANLEFARLGGADLRGANLIGADLMSVNFQDDFLFGIEDKRAFLSHAKLERAIYNEDTKFSTDFDPTTQQMLKIAPGVNLSNLNLSNAHLSGANLTGANFSNVNLNNADLSNADLSNADLSNANLSNTKFRYYNSELGDTLNGSANLKGSKQKRTIYNNQTKFPNNFFVNNQEMLRIAPGVNLSNADLSDLNLSNTDLKDVNLSNANLSNTGLYYAKNLTPEQVKSAKNWEKAKYDDEFKKKLGLK